MNLYRSLQIRFGIACAVFMPLTAGAEVIFREDFDSLKDFTSTMHSTDKAQTIDTGYTLPEGWYGLYQGTQWSPETGYPENHASLEILSSNTDKAYGGKGKSAVHWRESFSLGWKNWASDSQLLKVLDRSYPALYIEFDIRFSENWWQRDNFGNFTSKLFRVGSWSGDGSVFSGFQGELGPIFLWDYRRDQYGVRNVFSFRGGPHGENYNFNGEFRNDISSNFTSSLKGVAEDGGDPELYGYVSGDKLADSRESNLGHNEVFGPPGTWTKISFYVEMNSAPGINDGILRQWINGHQVVDKTNIPWIMENSENKMVGWNYFAIGGNDFFQPYDNEVRFEDWYAIDNVVVRDDIPSDIGSAQEGSDEPVADPATAPAPPSNLTVQ